MSVLVPGGPLSELHRSRISALEIPRSKSFWVPTSIWGSLPGKPPGSLKTLMGFVKTQTRKPHILTSNPKPKLQILRPAPKRQTPLPTSLNPKFLNTKSYTYQGPGTLLFEVDFVSFVRVQFLEIRDTFMEVTIIKSVAFWGSILGPPYFGRLPNRSVVLPLRISRFSSSRGCSLVVMNVNRQATFEDGGPQPIPFPE